MADKKQIKNTVRAYWVFIPSKKEMRCVLALPGENCSDAAQAAYLEVSEPVGPRDEEILLYLSDLSLMGRAVYRSALLFLVGNDRRRRMANKICWAILRLGQRNPSETRH